MWCQTSPPASEDSAPRIPDSVADTTYTSRWLTLRWLVNNAITNRATVEATPIHVVINDAANGSTPRYTALVIANMYIEFKPSMAIHRPMKYNTQSISFNKERLNEDNASRNIFKQASWHGLEGILVATPVALTFSDLLRAAALGLRVGDTGRSNAANTISWKLIPANVRSAPLHPMASTKAWSMGPNSRAPQLIPQDAIAAAAARFVVKYSWTITKIGMISRPEPSPAKRKFKNNQRQAVFFFLENLIALNYSVWYSHINFPCIHATGMCVWRLVDPNTCIFTNTYLNDPPWISLCKLLSDLFTV